MNSAGKAARLCSRLLKFAATNPAHLKHVLGTALAASDEVADHAHDMLRFPYVDVRDLLPANGAPLKVELALFPKTHASISALEFTCLILLLKQVQARNVFEFGTYKGVSITQLTLNLPPDSKIFTLDLPDEPGETRLAIADPEDAVIALEKGKGALVPPELRPRIRFLKQDSATFDVSPYAGQMDFVFVDGAHNYDYVRNDSEKGWQLLRKGGIIAWHDCRVQDPGVVECLLQSNFRPTRISGTSLAYAIKGTESRL